MGSSPGPASLLHPRPCTTAQTLLGAWEKNSGAGSEAASPLVQPLAVNGLANSFMAFNTNYHDTGLFGVYAVADPDADHEDLAWTILHKITGLTYGVSQTDVDRAKNQLKASVLFSGDGTTGGWCGGAGSRGAGGHPEGGSGCGPATAGPAA